MPSVKFPSGTMMSATAACEEPVHEQVEELRVKLGAGEGDDPAV